MSDPAMRAAALLKDHRCSIDRLDAILVYTLAERFKHTQAVGRLKAEHDLPPSDPTREAQQIGRCGGARHLAALEGWSGQLDLTARLDGHPAAAGQRAQTREEVVDLVAGQSGLAVAGPAEQPLELDAGAVVWARTVEHGPPHVVHDVGRGHCRVVLRHRSDPSQRVVWSERRPDDQPVGVTPASRRDGGGSTPAPWFSPDERE